MFTLYVLTQFASPMFTYTTDIQQFIKTFIFSRTKLMPKSYAFVKRIS